MSKKLIIDREFRSLIPVLTEEEILSLEESLKHEGCRDPLVTWQGKILDGHHRHKLCKIHGIEFRAIEAKVKDRTEAKIWIIKNQFGRRNLRPFQRCELALKLKPMIAAQAKEHQKLSKGRGQKGLLKKINLIDTEQELAELAGVSKSTMNQASIILERGNAEELQNARESKKPISHVRCAIKQRTKREELDNWKKNNRFKEDSEPVEGEPGTRIKYFTDKFGNECYEKETHPEWCKDAKVNVVHTGGYLKYNPAYKKIKENEADFFKLRFPVDQIQCKIAEIERELKKLLKKYPISIIQEAYEFDHDADSLESAKKYIWPEFLETAMRLMKILSKLEDG